MDSKRLWRILLPLLVAVASGKNSLSAVFAEPQPAGLPTLRADESLRAVIEKSLRVNYILRDEQDPTLVQVAIQVDRPPADMAFDMALRFGDRTWPLGPVGWSIEDGIRSWSYQVDLPETVRTVTVVLTPSANAAARLARQSPHWRLDLSEIWDGGAIVLPGIEIHRQHVGMLKRPPPAAEIAKAEALQQLVGDDPAVRELQRDSDIEKVRRQLRQRVQAEPNDAEATYNLGCLAAADSEWNTALEHFAAARRLDPSDALAEEIQRQLRRICSMYLYRAERDDVEAMAMLGTVYERGWGVHQNPQQAKRWFRNAANAGHAEAMCRLASMYERRVGATVHTPEAWEWYRTQTDAWYRKAANLGNEEAKRWLSAHDPE